jgi:hypothetical protein
VIVVENEQDEITSLRTLDPSLATLVRGPIPDVRQTDSADHVTVVERKQDRLLVDYSAASPRVVRLAIPSYPGWHAVLNGTELPTVTLDHALLGIIVPPGQGTISVRFVSNWFLFGALTSGACAALACAGAIGVIDHVLRSFRVVRRDLAHRPVSTRAVPHGTGVAEDARAC